MASHFIRGKYRDEHRIIGPSLDAIDNAYNVLLALPDRDTARFYRMVDHIVAVQRKDLAQMWLHVISDDYNWLKFFWYSTALKTRHLAAALVDAFNNDRYLAWLILARASLEYAAVSYYYAKRVADLDLGGPRFRASQLSALEELMLQYAHGSRFAWKDFIAGKCETLTTRYEAPPASRAINVLTALKNLAARDERFHDVQIAYDMLSDFAHPNMASHSVVIEMPMQDASMHLCEMAFAPGSLRGEFLMVMSLPWVSVGIGSVVEDLVALAPLMTKWIGYIEDGSTLECDLES